MALGSLSDLRRREELKGFCRSLPLLAGLIISVACEGPFGPDVERRVGVISFYWDPIVIEAPDTVQEGVPFSVMIRAYGDSCVNPGGVEVQVSNLVADVTPYVLVYTGRVCDQILMKIDQEAVVTLTSSGGAQVRFHGKEWPADSLITVTREVVVKQEGI
ncbi:hypothetical protein ACGF5M_00925 [Gemmatimonadota bacterium]